MANYFGYMRISTKEERGLQKFTRQEKALARFAAEKDMDYVLILREDESGSSFNHRKEWKKLESLIQAGDTIVFKDISRFIRNADEGYTKYMELLEKGIELEFIDNPIVSTSYIKELLRVAQQQDIIARTTLESTVKLLIIVELDRVEKELKTTVKRIKDGIEASEKKSGRKTGQLDKLTEELEADIKNYLSDRDITMTSLIEKHKISRNTLKKYVAIVKNQES